MRKVAKARPKITATPMVCHHWLLSPPPEKRSSRKSNSKPVESGISPKMVVTAVSNTGRNLVAPAAMTASRSSYPRSLSLFV